MNVLFVEEAVSLDHSQIRQLQILLGPHEAEEVTMRAMEELSARLSHAESLFLLGKWPDLRKCVRSLIAISDQIGMRSLAQVSQHVVTALDNDDHSGSAATFFRLLRIGDRSLSDYWELQNRSG
ncbi:hypothetical protein [Cognatishimia sp. WU-CL00825]|uniref:hypothetical protein n=1 Tax=Cognatishimia sp. WU-CL00825 TaxID=3127658 RepID=UPI0033657411